MTEEQEEKKFRLNEDGEKRLSLCESCKCITYSIDFGVCYKCEKCGETK